MRLESAFLAENKVVDVAFSQTNNCRSELPVCTANEVGFSVKSVPVDSRRPWATTRSRLRKSNVFTDLPVRWTVLQASQKPQNNRITHNLLYGLYINDQATFDCSHINASPHFRRSSINNPERCAPPIVVIRESGLTIIELELELELACKLQRVHIQNDQALSTIRSYSSFRATRSGLCLTQIEMSLTNQDDRRW